MITWDKWLNWACLKLKNSPSPQREAEVLLETVTQKTKTQLLAFGETILKNKQIKQLKILINRRLKGEPIAYLIGFKEFWSLKFTVYPGVFIPRPDTECLVEQVLHLISDANKEEILDLGTGVGTIALALASERPNWNIVGLDKQKKALALANYNKLVFNYKNVKFVYGNWFKHLQKKFNVIVSNPPYINKHDMFWLDNDIYFEPQTALISRCLGFADLIKICQHAKNYLYPYGWLFLEHGWNQGKFIRILLNHFKFVNICTKLDYHNCERVTYGQWKPLF